MAKIAVKHGTIAEVVVANKGDEPVFVFAYDLGPSWQVERVFRGSYYIVQSKDTRKRRLKMTMAESVEDQGKTCVDILKIIVTSKPMSFDVLALPRLREPARGRSDQATRKAVEGLDHWTATNFFIHILPDASQ